jgi:hypothetical protein
MHMEKGMLGQLIGKFIITTHPGPFHPSKIEPIKRCRKPWSSSIMQGGNSARLPSEGTKMVPLIYLLEGSVVVWDNRKKCHDKICMIFILLTQPRSLLLLVVSRQGNRIKSSVSRRPWLRKYLNEFQDWKTHIEGDNIDNIKVGACSLLSSGLARPRENSSAFE